MLVIQLQTRQVESLPLNGFQSEGRDITQLFMSVLWSQMYWGLWRRNTWNQESFQQEDLTWSRRQSEEVFLGKWCWKDTEDESVIQEETREWAGEGFHTGGAHRQAALRQASSSCAASQGEEAGWTSREGNAGWVTHQQMRRELLQECGENYLDHTLLCDQHTASLLSLNMTVAQRVRHCCPAFTGERWSPEAK